jgi:hypothetical protein
MIHRGALVKLEKEGFFDFVLCAAVSSRAVTTVHCDDLYVIIRNDATTSLVHAFPAQVLLCPLLFRTHQKRK